MKNMQNDCELVSKKNQIDFKWNLKFPINSLNIMRGYLFVDKDKQENYVNTFFEAYWNDNLDLSNEEVFSKLLRKLEIIKSNFLMESKIRLLKMN